MAKVHSEIKRGMELENIKGISLPGGARQQAILQFADDTSLTLRSKEAPIHQLFIILECFCLAIGLVLNWTKSRGFWHAVEARPPWTELLPIV